MPTPVLKLLAAVAADAADADLLGRFVASGDGSAFAELVRRHGPVVYRVCRRLVGPSSADDAFQATFLVLACRAKSVRAAGSVGSWLVGVAGRVSRQMARRDRRTAGISRLVGSDTEKHQPADASRSPELAELAAILDDELTRLPDDLRGPVVLCLLHGRTQEQAAAELGGSVRTVRRRLDRAKAVLRLRLERRGVVPAVAGGLIGSLGSAEAVPPELVRRAVDGVFEFLAGGASTPAAVVAKGVVGSMVQFKMTAAVAMAAAAAVLIGLGVGGADDKPAPLIPPANVPEPPLVPASPVPRATAPPVETRPVPAVSHRTANFVVYAASPVVARAVANEAEFQRSELAKKWLGTELADWPKQCEIWVHLTAGPSGGASTFNFGTDKAGNRVLIGTRIDMDLRGSFEAILTTQVPHEVTHCVLATHFGKALPRWADEGIALTSESEGEQARHDVLCRELLNAGRGIRLKTLFKMADYPKDIAVLYAQGTSVVRFLLTREGNRKGEWMPFPVGAAKKIIDLRKVELKSDPTGVQVTLFNPANSHNCLTSFLWIGGNGNTPESWDRAAKEVYGFASVDEMEEAWLDWLRKPESKLNGPPAPRPAAPKEDKPDLIPPTKLPGGERKP